MTAALLRDLRAAVGLPARGWRLLVRALFRADVPPYAGQPSYSWHEGLQDSDTYFIAQGYEAVYNPDGTVGYYRRPAEPLRPKLHLIKGGQDA